jgi:AraC-like DNA-binding protein
MDTSISLLTTLTLLGAVQGIFLSLALLNTRSGDIRAHRILALLTALFSIDLGEEFLYQTGFFEHVPNLLHMLAPVDLLYGPLIYLYVRQLTTPVPQGGLQDNYRHFIPALIGIFLLMPFFLLEGSEKLALTETVRKGGEYVSDTANIQLIESGLTLFILGTVMQLGVYLLLSIRLVMAYAIRIRNEFSSIEKINLNWLRNLLVGLGCIFLLYLGDQFFPDLMGMNILGDMVTVVVVILIYAMGYLGLRQPLIFTRDFIIPVTSEAESDAQAKEKYRKSGLDKKTGRLFLEQLSSYMETEKPYLDGGLILPQLAQQLGISANYLSQIINEQLQVNFYDFINNYRVEEAKRLIRDSAGRPNVLNIALDSGFNSKSAFYTAFKKATSMTPGEYRKTL